MPTAAAGSTRSSSRKATKCDAALAARAQALAEQQATAARALAKQQEDDKDSNDYSAFNIHLHFGRR